MAVRIRLKRFGTKNRLQWRVVVADVKSPREGRFIEQVGYYDPIKNPPALQLKLDRIENWMSQGAQPTETVRSLIKKAKRGRG